MNNGGRVRVTEKELRNDRDRDNDRYDRNDRYNDNYGMHEREFNAALREIRSQWIGSRKMTLARSTINDNRLNVAQVRQVLQSFSTDRQKLELARMAYRNTSDRNDFLSLRDVFESRSSREEFERLIRSNRY